MRFPDERSRRWWGKMHDVGAMHGRERMEMEGGRGGRGRRRREQWAFEGGPGGGFHFGPLGHFGHGPRFGHGPKVGRGDVRLSVLRLLAEEPRNGYQIIQELTDRSGGVWRPSPGSVYPALQQLEDEGLIRAEEKDGKRVFRLTEAGQGAFQALGADVAAPWETAAEAVDTEAGAQAMEWRSLMSQVATAFVQVAQAGDDAQMARAKDVMINTRRALYRILAEDDAESQPNT